jgi:RNA polymerase sigma-70 factor (ECF subfamily)
VTDQCASGGDSSAAPPEDAPPATVAAAHAAAERAARHSYGRLVAVLAASSGDLALAEDALADAFESALVRWPRDGVPANPEGWLVTVARNRQRDVWKSAAHRASVPFDDGEADASGGARRSGAGAEASTTERGDPLAELDPFAIPDKRLELLAVCAHPAIDPEVRAPLMLQAVLGFDAAQIATAFAVPQATMAQRLVRAKRRIQLARIPFEIPERRQLDDRVPALLEAVYGCAAIDWRGDSASLAGEAQYLAVVLATLLDREPEAWGLAALVTLSLARRRPGAFIPLEEQDPRDWDAAMLDEGEAYLRRASARGGVPGRFRLEAAIQAVHADRRRTGTTDWAALRSLSTALVAVAPSLGARVALAAVIGRTDGAEAGREALPEASTALTFQPWWATRADLLLRTGRLDEARAAFRRAAELTEDAEVRAYLEARGETQNGAATRR